MPEGEGSVSSNRAASGSGARSLPALLLTTLTSAGPTADLITLPVRAQHPLLRAQPPRPPTCLLFRRCPRPLMNRRRRPGLGDMAKVLTHMCMSLDGFVAQPDDNPAELFDWYWGGDVVVPSAQPAMSFSVDAASAPMLRDLTSGCGALVAGRRLFDHTDGWGDNHPAGAPVVVVTHRPPPERAGERFPRTTFTGSVEEAVATAKEIAGDKFATIASADIIQQALNL